MVDRPKNALHVHDHDESNVYWVDDSLYKLAASWCEEHIGKKHREWLDSYEHRLHRITRETIHKGYYFYFDVNMPKELSFEFAIRFAS